MIQPNATFKSDDLEGIVERVQRNVIATDANGPETVACKRVNEIKGTHDEDLFPPPGAVLTHLCWRRGGGVICHDASTLGRQG